jgi:hypothetical protein
VATWYLWEDGPDGVTVAMTAGFGRRSRSTAALAGARSCQEPVTREGRHDLTTRES